LGMCAVRRPAFELRPCSIKINSRSAPSDAGEAERNQNFKIPHDLSWQKCEKPVMDRLFSFLA
jgi:hypothetical protein